MVFLNDVVTTTVPVFLEYGIVGALLLVMGCVFFFMIFRPMQKTIQEQKDLIKEKDEKIIELGDENQKTAERLSKENQEITARFAQKINENAIENLKAMNALNMTLKEISIAISNR